MPRAQARELFVNGLSKKIHPLNHAKSRGKTHFRAEQNKIHSHGFLKRLIILRKKQHFRPPLVTGVVDALMGQREILCGNLGKPYVYQGASVWRLDRGMDAK